ncbi:MAG TPA: UDP-3-O-(3-hydroxymyristoyl)glucosamine N-acyltransferase [Candidatus Saccharimonadales bacterium]|jgi:UDP-3-O-[3-hydroxymyristoyl] glucosamine N-acyltransferase|nr:UDP-3-O-(3-hydroxymyristoyl)glucosamine N-acyltransferase [Candidatus Saccharimonadales bacterium]
MKLKEIAARLGARLDPPEADADIHGVAAIESAAPGEITFLANPKYTAAAHTTRASAIIADEAFSGPATPLLRTKNPHYAYLRAVALFYHPPEYDAGIHPSAIVHPSARLGKNVSIGPYVVIDADVEIGGDCTLVSHVAIYRGVKIGRNFFAHSHVSVREHCRIGDNVILHNGVVVGSDGFGFAKDDGGRWQKIHQAGRVVIEDDVEVQANSCIDRATLGETRIGRGTKIDNLVQIGHNCTVGENNMICAQVGAAGSTRLGNNVILAGQVGIAGHCSIGDSAILTAQSGVSHDVEAGQMLSGSPAFDNRQWLRSVAAFSRLPEFVKAVRAVSGPKKKD